MRWRASWPASGRQLAVDRLVDGERSQWNVIADTPDGDLGRDAGPVPRAAAAGAMAAIDTVLLAALKDGMLGNDVVEVEDTDQVGQLLDVDDTAGAIGHAIIVAADGDETVVADTALELEIRTGLAPRVWAASW
jgi:hypothetical protein